MNDKMIRVSHLRQQQLIWMHFFSCWVFNFPEIWTKLSYYTYSTENGFNFYKQVSLLI